MTAGSDLIAAERERQIAVEGWTPEHDDEHDLGQLIDAAICYAMRAGNPTLGNRPPVQALSWALRMDAAAPSALGKSYDDART